MTVLFLARRFYPEIGGVEKHVLEVSKKLAAKGYKIVVISEQPQESYSDDYQSNLSSARLVGKLKNIESYNIKPGKDDWFKKFRIWIQLWKYRNLIKQADIVHCHDVFFWYLPFRFIFPKKPVFTTFHGYEGNNLPTSKVIFMHKFAEKLSWGNICVGDFLKKWYGTKPTYVTYGAVDLSKFKNGGNRNEAIFIGRLEEETGIMKYLEALKFLKDKKNNLKLIILGGGSLENKARKYAKENSLNVDFKGFVEDAERYINSGKYIFVSRYLGILEAMAARKPVFAEYNNDIKKDYLEMAPFAGFISISADGKEIGKNLADFINGKRILGADKGYEWVKNKTWENMTNLYLRLWDNK